MLILVLMCNFSKYWLWGKFHPKICCSPYLLKFSVEIQWTYISQNKLEEASQGCKNVLVNERVFYRFYHFSFAHQQVLKFCVYLIYLSLDPRPNSLYCAPETAQYNSASVQCAWLWHKEQVAISWKAKLSWYT